MIQFNVKDDTFIILDKNRITIYDSRIGFVDLEALSLKDELDNDKINNFIDYIKPLMNSAKNRNTINKYNFIFYFNKLLTAKGTKYAGYAASAIR